MKKKKAKKNQVRPVVQPPNAVQSEENEKPFDFGGLPVRDLKKNLGCG